MRAREGARCHDHSPRLAGGCAGSLLPAVGRHRRVATRPVPRGCIRQQLPAGALGPSPATVRRWRAAERWQEWAGGDVPPLPFKNMPQWHRMWCRHVLRQMDAALTLQMDVLLGTFDRDPGAGVAVLTTSAATMEQLLAQPSVRALLRMAFSEGHASPVSLTRRERRVWARLQRRYGAR